MHTMHLLPGVAIQPNLELKTLPKPVLGSLPLAFALPELVLVLECRRALCLQGCAEVCPWLRTPSSPVRERERENHHGQT